jgi:hypothetical protein
MAVRAWSGRAESSRWWLVATALFACGLNLSGSRIALVIGLVAVLAASVLGVSLRRAVVALAFVAIGLLVAAALPETTYSGTDRVGDEMTLSTAGSGLRPRVAAWQGGLEGWAHRPILGWGPGRFQEANTPYAPVEVVEGQDVVFFDAHNIGIELLATLGLVGFVAVVAFAVLASNGCRGELCWFAAAATGTMLLQPMSLHTIPLVVLALGGARVARLEVPRVPRSVLGKGALALVLTVSATLALDYVLMARNLRVAAGRDAAAGERAASLMPWSAPLQDLVSQYSVQPVPPKGSEAAERALELVEKPIQLNPGRYLWWVRRGDFQGALGSIDEAEVSYREALARYPWSEKAWRGLALVARKTDDTALLAEADGALCEIGSTLCGKIEVEEP